MTATSRHALDIATVAALKKSRIAQRAANLPNSRCGLQFIKTRYLAQMEAWGVDYAAAMAGYGDCSDMAELELAAQ
jgi:hypothetical protein